MLIRINGERLTRSEFLSWLIKEYDLSGKRSPYGYYRVAKECLGFIYEENGTLKLTSKAKEFLESNDPNKLLLDVLKSRIVGFEEIFSILANGRRLEFSAVQKELNEKCGVKWKSSLQTAYRLNWLISLGYVDKKGGEYFLVKGPPPGDDRRISKYVNYAIAQIQKYPEMSEKDTISTLIEPLLEILGWDVRNLDEVQREYSIPKGEKTEHADIALKVNNKPVIFIEAKSVNTDLRDSLAEQPIGYANMGGVNWCILTNGKEWRLYNAFWRVKGIDQKMFLKFSINELTENIEKLLLLSKESVASGRLDDGAGLEHAKRTISEWLKERENMIISEVKKLDPSLRGEHIRKAIGEYVHR
jgi:hypothetical protein